MLNETFFCDFQTLCTTIADLEKQFKKKQLRKAKVKDDIKCLKLDIKIQVNNSCPAYSRHHNITSIGNFLCEFYSRHQRDSWSPKYLTFLTLFRSWILLGESLASLEFLTLVKNLNFSRRVPGTSGTSDTGGNLNFF